MLILCTGPDTYHARKKAQELVVAFRQKHDPTGYSTEVASSADFQDILKRLGSPSLFAQRRLIRCDGLLEGLKIADVRALAKRLEQDADQTILLSIEEDPLVAKIEKEFEKIKLVQYAHPLLAGVKFVTAVTSRAKELGVPVELAQTVARNTDGDMWLADQELQKCAANPQASLVRANIGENSVFDAAESFIAERKFWRARLVELDEPENVLPTFLAQTRTCVRVTDGEASGVHPYAARKFSLLRVSVARAREAFHRALKTFSASRSGMCTTDESDILF